MRSLSTSPLTPLPNPPSIITRIIHPNNQLNKPTVLFGNGTHSPANNTDNCGDLGVTEGAQVRTSTNLQPPTTDQSYDNRTFYESVVSNASPFFLIGMMKESPGKWSDEQWGDARLICASPAKTIRESAATRAAGRDGGVWGVMATGVVVVLFGMM